ncbi:MAG: DEAD/DEAH box helicase [gamma proteobacterium endosymbiont of Lamellibrachia anaximandri]|nr:DEAD/DEAH box helicase [gamma proteobacterium endosymbiont of Lamellibrachia anaximandri]MBL3534742.1 DEAD/DEAH box helicase [gamma proteobacterium endosymbiont of Lamellibrachia anaximandri]
MIHTLKDLRKRFGPAWVEQGSRFLKNHANFIPQVQRGGALITALINTGQQRLRVYVRVQMDPGEKIQINGECSCSSGQNCSHVAAVLIKVLLDEQEIPGEAPETRKAKHPLGRPVAGLLDYPPGVHQRLIYLLRPDPADPSRIEVETRCARALKNGGYAEDRIYEPAWAQRGTPPRFLLQTDLDILAGLNQGEEVKPSLKGKSGEQLLRAILETGRCHLGHISGRILRRGKPQPATPCWDVDSIGSQRIRWHQRATIFLASLWCLESDRCTPLTTDLPDVLVAKLTAMPPVTPEQVPKVTADLQKHFPDTTLPPLRQIRVERRPPVVPQPCLHLCGQEMPLACLSFKYHEIRIGTRGPPLQFKDGTQVHLIRDEPAEQRCIEQLITLDFRIHVGQSRERATDCFSLVDELLPWLDFQSRQLPEWETQGWRVTCDKDFPHRLARPDHWYSELEPLETEADDYGISVGVVLEGRRINLLPVLVKWLHELPPERRGERLDGLIHEHGMIVPLEDGRHLLLPRNRVRQIMETLFELHDSRLDEMQRLRLNRFQLARLAELDESPDGEPLQWLGAEALHSLAETLRNIGSIPAITPPAGLRAELRPYQQRGLDWLQFLRTHRLGGILADDMGLGKTVQTLAHLVYEKEQGQLDRPSLVIAPTSLMTNWLREAQRFAPDLRTRVLHGPLRHELFEGMGEQDLLITTYPLLLRDQDRLLDQAYHLLILDEAQAIKNPKAKVGAIVRQLNARHRICLTGTPVENHLGELWSLFDFLLPGLLGEEHQFRRRCRKPIEKWGDEHQADRLRRRIRPFLLRRTKQAVAPELPPKTEILRTVALQGAQRELYEDIRLNIYRRVREAVDERGISRCGILILTALLKLRQVCCDPRLISPEERGRIETGHSAKLELLMDLLPEMIEEGRHILLFSQFTSMLELIEQALQTTGIDYVLLTGRTRDRATPIDRFQTGKVPLFLISLKAGGMGLNLTAADTVIHYDPWWNPAVERQATDRAHRIGQENPVFVYKLISEGTVEERIQIMQERKQALADGLYDSTGAADPQWTENDLDELFGPLA